MKQTREFEDYELLNDDILTFSICSNEPYARQSKEFGEYLEVLTISEDAIDWSRLGSGNCAFLENHDDEKQIGVITKAWIDGNKVKCNVKFSKNDKAQSIIEDIKSGIRTNTSIGYQIQDYHFVNQDGIKVMIVDKFMIYEASSVSIPADPTVGYNRSLDIEENEDMKDCKKETETVETTDTVEEVKSCGECEETTENVEEVKACGECDKVEDTKECDKDSKVNDAEEIASLGDLVGQKSLALDFINAKRSLNEFKLELKKLNAKKEDKVEKDIKKMEKFSLRKAIANAMGVISDEDASYERSIIDENKRKFGSTAEIVVTKEQLRGFPDGSESLNQSIYRPDLYTENLRPQNVIAKTGAKVVSVDGPDITFGVCTSGLNAGFVDLNGEIPSAYMDWELKTMQPKKLGCYVQVSKKALLQDRPDIENIILTDITKALNQCKDEAAVCGDGNSNKPTGVYYTSGINEVTLPSGSWTLSTALAFEKPIRDSNDFSENLSWVMNSQMYYKLAATPKSAAEQNTFLIGDTDRKMIGYPCVICNALPASGIILGNFDELLVAEFNAMEVSVETDAGLSRKQAKEIQAFEAIDVLVRRKKSFTKGK